MSREIKIQPWNRRDCCLMAEIFIPVHDITSVTERWMTLKNLKKVSGLQVLLNTGEIILTLDLGVLDRFNGGYAELPTPSDSPRFNTDDGEEHVVTIRTDLESHIENVYGIDADLSDLDEPTIED